MSWKLGDLIGEKGSSAIILFTLLWLQLFPPQNFIGSLKVVSWAKKPPYGRCDWNFCASIRQFLFTTVVSEVRGGFPVTINQSRPIHLMKLGEFTPEEVSPHKLEKRLVAAVCSVSALGCKFQMLVWKLQELWLWVTLRHAWKGRCFHAPGSKGIFHGEIMQEWTVTRDRKLWCFIRQPELLITNVHVLTVFSTNYWPLGKASNTSIQPLSPL